MGYRYNDTFINSATASKCKYTCTFANTRSKYYIHIYILCTYTSYCYENCFVCVVPVRFFAAHTGNFTPVAEVVFLYSSVLS